MLVKSPFPLILIWLMCEVKNKKAVFPGLPLKLNKAWTLPCKVRCFSIAAILL